MIINDPSFLFNYEYDKLYQKPYKIDDIMISII